MMLIAEGVGWTHYLFAIPLSLLSIFLVLVILVQRGRGGGLTGALGGMGGQSAFGTKAGDLFTRITIVVAAIWILLSMASLKVLNQRASTGGLDPNQKGQVTPVSIPGGKTPAVKGEESSGSDAKAPDEKGKVEAGETDASKGAGGKATEGNEPSGQAAPATTGNAPPATTPSASPESGAKPGDPAKP